LEFISGKKNIKKNKELKAVLVRSLNWKNQSLLVNTLFDSYFCLWIAFEMAKWNTSFC